MPVLLSSSASTLDVAGPANAPVRSLYPEIADISHATPALVEFLRHYLQTKSGHDATARVEDFDTSNISYIDAVLGFQFTPANFEATMREIVGAVMFFEDTEAIFGTQLRGIAALDMVNGKIVRQVDYWDGRRSALADTRRVPESQYPTDFAESTVQRAPNPVLQGIIKALHAALSTGNSTPAPALFHNDAVCEDRTTRTIIDGRMAVERYLARASSSLPYGTGATVRHIVGRAQGGGYEWIGGPGAGARHGMTALKLDENRMITLISPVWDASYASDATMVALVGLSLEP